MCYEFNYYLVLNSPGEGQLLKEVSHKTLSPSIQTVVCNWYAS